VGSTISGINPSRNDEQWAAYEGGKPVEKRRAGDDEWRRRDVGME
jgi:hypothetical protein